MQNTPRIAWTMCWARIGTDSLRLDDFYEKDRIMSRRCKALSVSVLEMAIFSSAGWSETGGPWVRPEQAMKKLVWSQTLVQGPRRFTGKLAQPPSNNGPIRNLRTGGGRGASQPDPTYYSDSAVVAFPTPAAESNVADLNTKVTTS